MTDRPNVLLIMTDQHRGDAIGADPRCLTDANGRPLVHTPNIDQLVGNGVLFGRAYTPAPSSIPARRCLWTGQTPATNGCTNWVTEAWDFEATLPGALSRAGYQTRLTGKTHSIPPRNHFGFEDIVLHAGLSNDDDDYSEWLERETGGDIDEISHGVGRNSWDARPSHLPERLHPTTWTADRAIDFFEKRDPTRPFFHVVSFVRPHQPYDPPEPYWDMYADRDLSGPSVGEWARDVYGDYLRDHPSTSAWCADLPTETIRRARVGYYGSITHVDHQINRLLRALRSHDLLADTVVLFTADHGDMLGDHYLWRKTYAFEGSARVPLVVRFPEHYELERSRVIQAPVGLEDITPTILELTDVDEPSSVEGSSLRPLIDGDSEGWRERYHGEHGPIYHEDNAMQYLVGDATKYVWNPVTGDELLFDLDRDPGETRNLATEADHRDELDGWREALASRLAGRPEGYSDGEHLRTVE